ncbi:putative DEAD-box ATP-dependent RNA helicase 35 [Blattamonas nauphoetae]|uniref:RNA helicase n=1 Tax=Blattamonas nauphoetae TaxID=2049346 RepID=A0ABQ9YEV1_9EUKA|nr:putative DEAD-box ATP-dependent RNA helicase 35 [Blattamonas nauphoetae]
MSYLKRKRYEADLASEQAEKRPATLIEEHVLVKLREAENPESEAQKIRDEEDQIVENLVETTERLAPVSEKSRGIIYTDPMPSTWTPPKYLQSMPESDRERIREKYHILCDGENIPPPVLRFKDFKLPQPILDTFKKKGIKTPTPIQIQAMSCALSGRDVIGIAYTGSGKTLIFVLPAIMFSLEEQLKMPVEGGEGPFALMLCPSRELARQTYNVTMEFVDGLARGGFPKLRVLLCIGGINMEEQRDILRYGPHIVIATPGRLNEMLGRGRFSLDFCKYVVLDEADRMFDTNFDEDVRNIFDFFKYQRQTLLFSATMPKKVQEFARMSLVKPIIVNTGRAGAANMDVIQEVELVKEDAKMVYLLQALEKTGPPVLIFCENKIDVDRVNEYLLIKGVRAVSMHGGKDQTDREQSISRFKDGTADVLVATDVASKGLDFPNIRHVINYDMPREIENYIHRIGRTGRGDETGVATTFINKNSSDSVLLDLKHLLMEAKQHIPEVLKAIPDPHAELYVAAGTKGCAICGGLGHLAKDCPKWQMQTRRVLASAISSTRGEGSDW